MFACTALIYYFYNRGLQGMLKTIFFFIKISKAALAILLNLALQIKIFFAFKMRIAQHKRETSSSGKKTRIYKDDMELFFLDP